MTGVVPGPLPGEIEAIVRRVHRRWQSRLLGGSVLALAALVVVTAYAGRPDGLKLESVTTPDEPRVTRSARATSTPTRSPSPARPTVSTKSQRPAEIRTTPGGISGSRTPFAGGTATRMAKPAVWRGVYTRPSGTCDEPVTAPVVGDGRACFLVKAEPRPGNGARLRILECLPSGHEPTRYSFDTDQEVDFVVRRAGQPVWTWSAGQRFRGPGRQFQLSGDLCHEWNVLWAGTDESGAAVGGGEYTLHGVMLSTEFDGRREHDTSFTLD